MKTLMIGGKNRTRGIALVAVLLSGVLLGFGASYLFLFPYTHSLSHTEERAQGRAFRFVSPLLACSETKFDHIGNDVLLELEKKLNAYTSKAQVEKRAGTVAVYFRQLKGGPWVGIEEEAVFTPGSLLKVPLAMAVYKVAEYTPSFLEAVILYEGRDVFAPQYFKNTAVEPGKEYAVRELVEKMLMHSDNNAAGLLSAVLSDEQLTDTYAKLGIALPEFGVDYQTSVHRYASFFRILYNATYLTAENSEHLLEVLTHATFTQGLVAGVPDTVPVAHKFGERTVEGSLNVQLHDCGIVYHPERPYLLCVMTQGTDFNILANVIRDISKITYESID